MIDLHELNPKAHISGVIGIGFEIIEEISVATFCQNVLITSHLQIQ